MADEWEEQLGWLDVRNYRLRRMLTRPRAPHEKNGNAAILFIAGLSPRSTAAPLAVAHPRDGWPSLMRIIADTGFVTYRVEHSGVGESGGPAYADSDLGSELDGYSAALDEIFQLPFVDPSRVFLFGHSLGGLLAPLLAEERSVAGIAVYGTPSRSWGEAMAGSARRQLVLAGRSAQRVQIEAARASIFYSLLLRKGFDEERLAKERPEIAGCLASANLKGSMLHGRSLDYLREIEALDIGASFGRVPAPVLALQGEHDWVAAADDYERIITFSQASSEASACLLLGVDHDFQRHPSITASFTNRGRGDADRSAADATIAWMRRRPSRIPISSDGRIPRSTTPPEASR
jgi:uncharacterized protein